MGGRSHVNPYSKWSTRHRGTGAYFSRKCSDPDCLISLIFLITVNYDLNREREREIYPVVISSCGELTSWLILMKTPLVLIISQKQKQKAFKFLANHYFMIVAP